MEEITDTKHSLDIKIPPKIAKSGGQFTLSIGMFHLVGETGTILTHIGMQNELLMVEDVVNLWLLRTWS